MNKNLKKLVLASILASLSIVFDVLVNMIIPWDNFSIPLYVLPIIMGSHILGSMYGGVIGFVSDLVSFMIYGKGTFNIIFSISSILWGVIPGLVLRKKRSLYFVLMVIFVVHLMATLAHSFALSMMYTHEIAYANFILRAAMVPVNTIFLSSIYYILTQRLENQIGVFLGYESKSE